MDSKAMIEKVLVALITAVVLGALGFFAGVFEKGATAMNEDQIEAVIQRIMVTDAGETYAATLMSVNGTLIALDTKVGELKEDVNDLEDAVRTLASE